MGVSLVDVTYQINGGNRVINSHTSWNVTSNASGFIVVIAKALALQGDIGVVVSAVRWVVHIPLSPQPPLCPM